MSRKIIGVTVGSSLPKPNFKQTDPTKGDYIRNKPDFDGLKDRVDTVSGLVGDTSVSEQITNAISEIEIPEHTWETLPDKPFGEISTGSSTLTIPYNKEGFEVIYNGSTDYYHVSDNTPTIDELSSGVTTIHDGMTEDLTPVAVGEEGAKFKLGSFGATSTFIAWKDNATINNITFPKKGIYVRKAVTSLTISGYEFTESATLDSKYIGDDIARVSDIEVLNAKVGDKTVSEQIAAATENKLVPSCTTADNGKFLRVVDGVATWVTISNAEGVSF